jgi:hypothetical protein
MSRPNSLKIIKNFAETLDSQQFLDSTSNLQRAMLREQADGLREVCKKQGLPVTADTLVAFVSGATMQAAMTAAANPLMKTMNAMLKQDGDSTEANPVLMLMVAYLARDILAGRRVE